jgi:hypothetical protein
MERGQLIAVNGRIVEYDRYDKYLNIHFGTEVEIDEEGILTATYIPCCFNTEELANREINLTQEQWIGLTKHFIRQEYVIDDEEIHEAAEDIVCREFAILGVPTVEELYDIVETYMNR